MTQVIQESADTLDTHHIRVFLDIVHTLVFQAIPAQMECLDTQELMASLDILDNQVQVIQEEWVILDTPELKVFLDMQVSMDIVDIQEHMVIEESVDIVVSQDMTEHLVTLVKKV